MGYLLFLIFVLTWLNVRKIRKAVVYLAVQEGYSGSLKTKILDVITDYAAERKDIKKTRKKLQKEKKLKDVIDREPAPESEVQDETSYSWDYKGYYLYLCFLFWGCFFGCKAFGDNPFDLKLFIIVFITFSLVCISFDVIDYIYAKRSKSEVQDD